MAAKIAIGGSAVFLSFRGKPGAPQAAKVDRPTPVVVSTVGKADEAVYRIGQGTVQAFNEVSYPLQIG
jgi:hypothetical protein